MNEHIEALSNELTGIETLDQFWDRILLELANYGVTSLSYAAIATHADALNGSQATSVIGKSNHTQKYFDSFSLDQLVENSPAQGHATGSAKPVIWQDRRGIQCGYSSKPDARR